MALNRHSKFQKKYCSVINSEGLMLVELIISLALLSVVIAVGFTIYSYTNTSFTKGEQQTVVQSNVRGAANFIVREVRYATNLEILNDLPDDFNPKRSYIYVKNEALNHDDGNGNIQPVYGGVGRENVIDQINFKRNENNSNLLYFKIKGNNSGVEYLLDSEIQILNLDNDIDITDIKDNNPQKGSVISYTTLSKSKTITEFWFDIGEKRYNGYIDELNKTISVIVPETLNLTDIKASFVHNGNKVMIGNIEQESGITPNDFSSLITYTVFADDGSIQDYNITVSTKGPEILGLELRNEEYSPVFNTDTEIIADYTYIPNDNGSEGNSVFVWERSVKTSEDEWEEWEEINTYNGDNTFDPIEEGGNRIRVKVTPVSESGAAGEEVISDFIYIAPVTENTPFWKKLVTDLWYMDLMANEELGEDDPDWSSDKAESKNEFDEYRNEHGLEEYEDEIATHIRQEILTGNSVDSTFRIIPDIEEENIIVEGTKHYDGVHFSIDLENFVDDIDNYTIVFDAELKREGNYLTNGWGMTFNGKLDSENKDAGYMYQFDPGADGYLVRRNNYNHNIIPDMGVFKEGETNSGITATYRPNRINNDNFNWQGNDSNSNQQWYEDYTSEITVQKQLDDSLIFRVRTWQTDRGRENMAEEMWFGDFGEVTYNNHKFKGQKVVSGSFYSNKSLYEFSNNQGGSYLGLRSWSPSGKMFRAEFKDLRITDGFKLDINKAQFLTRELIRLEFDQPLDDRKDRYNLDQIVLTGGVQVEDIIFLENNEGFIKEAVLVLNGPLEENYAINGSSGNKFLQGSIRKLHAGDVKITNGNNITIEGRPENIFSDNFQTGQFNWTNYRNGVVEKTKEQNISGKFSLKKINSNDPHGGYKEFNSIINRGFIFEGWIYSPSDRSGGTQDRISITNSDFNGYGIGISGNNIYIERRQTGDSDAIISDQINWERSNDEWYRFVFTSNNNNTLTLFIYDKDGSLQSNVTSQVDDTYESFDRVIVQGGHHYYVDNLNVLFGD